MTIRTRLSKPANVQAFIVSVALIAMGALLLGVQRSMTMVENALRSNLKVAVFIQKSLSDADAEAWAKTLPTIDPQILSADFVSKAEALKRAQSNPALSKSLMLLRDNPLPASVILRFRDSAWLDRAEPDQLLKGQAQIQEVRWDPEARTMFHLIHEWEAKVQPLALAALIIGVLAFIATSSGVTMALAIVCALPLASSADSYNTMIKRYEKQIHQQERQLTRLRSRLAEKEKNVSQWQGKAEAAKTEWNQASKRLDETKNAVKLVHEKRQKTRILADSAQWKSTENTLLARSADAEAHALAQDLYAAQMAQSPASLSVDEAAPSFLFERMAALSASSQENAEAAQKEEAALRNDEMRWQRDEFARSQEADRLHEKQEAQWLKWQEALKRKTALEDEISQIDQSAKALDVMVQELRDHRDQAKALHDNAAASDAALASLRGTLPWPAQGKVVQNFGRQYSTDLNQLVVSNGIKIDSGAHHTVRAIQEGKVLYADPFREYGQLVIVQHKNGLTSVYGGLGETQVKEGQVLAALDQIGSTSEAGSFYFELRRDEQPVNPLAYLAPRESAELSSRRTFK